MRTAAAIGAACHGHAKVPIVPPNVRWVKAAASSASSGAVADSMVCGRRDRSGDSLKSRVSVQAALTITPAPAPSSRRAVRSTTKAGRTVVQSSEAGAGLASPASRTLAKVSAQNAIAAGVGGQPAMSGTANRPLPTAAPTTSAASP